MGTPLTDHDRENWEEDHFIEIQSLSLFTEWAIRSGSVPPEFFTDTMGKKLPRDRATNEYPPVAGGENLPVPRYRVMVALGSAENSRDFMMLMCNLNAMKGKFWVGESPIADKYMENLLQDAAKRQDGDTSFYFQILRNARAVVSFMNHPQVQLHAMRIIRNVRWEMYLADLNHQRLFPGQTAGALGAWDTWIHHRLHYTVEAANQFIRKWAQRAVDRFHKDQTPVGQAIHSMGNVFLARSTTTFNDSSLPREFPPPSPDTY